MARNEPISPERWCVLFAFFITVQQARSPLKLGNQNRARNQTIAKKAKRKRKNTMRKTKNRALSSRKWEKCTAISAAAEAN
jgi:hypothetical protein